jgi:hypothetical protein
MRTVRSLLIAMAAVALAACSSGGSDNSLSGGAGGGGGAGAPTTPAIATLTLLTSSPQMPSDGSADATITALVRDSNNNVVPDVTVIFSADSGSLATPTPAITDANGQLTTTLATASDPTNRTITVTALADTLQTTITVDVVGTNLTLNGPGNLAQNDTGTYNVVLTDAGGSGIPNVDVTLASANGNTLSSATVTTGASGQASFDVTASTGGSDTLTADALMLTASQPLVVSNDAFAFTAPAANTEIDLGASQSATVNWQQNGANVVGQQVTFSTTRGTVTPSIVNTDGAGNATASVTAQNAGPAVITATNAGGTSTQLDVEFVATVPDMLDLQADPFTIAPSEQSAITAIVRDPTGNLVKNTIVSFQLTDVTGGSLSVAQAITDSQGRAQTFYTASNTTSASNGVIVTGTVQSAPTVNDTVAITVAQRELFISIGTGNEIFEENSAQFRQEFIVQVTDSQGNGVEDVSVSVSILSVRYREGFLFLFPDAITPDHWEAFIAGVCTDEDTNRNGVLDGAEDGLVLCNGILDVGEDTNGNGVLDLGEDANGSCRIEAGNIATAVVQGGAGGGTLQTDGDGFGLVDVFYPQQYNVWVEVTLEAKTSVQGTEFAESQTFTLSGLAADFSNVNSTPPGGTSPFGIDGNCATFDP